jgi:hypothetical protein
VAQYLERTPMSTTRDRFQDALNVLRDLAKLLVEP